MHECRKTIAVEISARMPERINRGQPNPIPGHSAFLAFVHSCILRSHQNEHRHRSCRDIAPPTARRYASSTAALAGKRGYQHQERRLR